MEGSFIEMIVKAKTTGKGWAFRLGAVLLILLAIVSVLFIGPFGIFIIGLFGYLTYKVFQYTDLEYEYSYLNGELTVDKIMGQIKRKRVIEVDLRECEVAAYEGSAKLDYQNGPGYTILDVSTGQPGAKRMAIIIVGDGKRTKLLFEPSEKLATTMRDYAPNKVFLN